MMLRMNFYIGTVKDQIYELFPDPAQRTDIGKTSARPKKHMPYFVSLVYLAETFDLLLPAGGLVAVPVVGWLLDHVNHSTTFFIVITFSLLFGILRYLEDPSSSLLLKVAC
jgi:FtsH-binding integral membrane protein